jgi:hypothetical protein
MMQIDKLPLPDRRGRFIAAHRRFIGQCLSDSFITIHNLAPTHFSLRSQQNEGHPDKRDQLILLL